jgi:NADPH2:quinone reductase
MVGGALFDVVRRVMAFEGRIVVVGFTGGSIPEVRVNQLLLRSFGVLGVNAYTVAMEHPALHKEARAAVVDLLARGAISPSVGALRPCRELIELSEELGNRRVSGKAVIQLSPAT